MDITNLFWRQVVLLLIELNLASMSVEALSSGSPETACASMKPQHGISEQRTSSPYLIKVSPSTINRQQMLTVTIRPRPGNPTKSFKGFLMQAKPTLLSQKVGRKGLGSFKPVQGAKLLNCFGMQSSSITHQYAQNFRDVQVEWIPPSNFTGRITIVATVVKAFKEFWMGIESDPVTVT